MYAGSRPGTAPNMKNKKAGARSGILVQIKLRPSCLLHLGSTAFYGECVRYSAAFFAPPALFKYPVGEKPFVEGGVR